MISSVYVVLQFCSRPWNLWSVQWTQNISFLVNFVFWVLCFW